ncbi:uncharacterized protein [Cherax quadricarinatus]|uniref:uncharacterized protein isoform X8 n=1 Tax=Cherax quadricarinatus TaxID=27406 RepID=UPI00387E2AD8
MTANRLHSRPCRRGLEAVETITTVGCQEIQFIYNCLMFHVQDWLPCMNFFILDDPSRSHIVMMEMTNLPSLVFFHCRESEVNNLIQAIKKINQYKKQEDLIYTVPQYLEEPLQMLTQETKTHIRIVRFHSFIYQPHLDTDPLSLDDREGHLSINK